MEKEQKSSSFIIRQAENIIDDYEKNKKKDKHNIYFYKEKYERLKILRIALGFVGSIGILISIVIK